MVRYVSIAWVAENMPIRALQDAVALQRSGQLTESELVCRQIVAHSPKDPAATRLLGLLCYSSGKLREAVQWILTSIEADPGVAESHGNLAAVLGSMGRLQEAVAALGRAINLAPDHAPSHHNLGVTLERLGRIDEAEHAYRRAVELSPHDAKFHHHLGNALRQQQRFIEASQAYQRALTYDPDHAEAWVGLATIAGERGLPDQAIACCRRAAEVAPKDAETHSNLLFALHYDPGLSAAEIFQEHAAWAEQHERPRLPKDRIHHHDRSPNRRLRVGYVSADFREHTRARFIEPVLAHHDHKACEIYCYSDVRHPDSTTTRFRRYADVWRETGHLTDAQMMRRICQDRIDVLMDLTGHMGNNRLPVFAYKPSPVQVAYPGYPNSTGLRSIQYILTDVARDPPGAANHYTEELIYLEPTSQVYWPGDVEHAGPEIAPPPCLSNGYVTFGSLNKPIKANGAVLDAWSRILTSSPNSRLMIPAKEQDLGGQPVSSLANGLAARGIDRARIDLVTNRRRSDYLELYNRIDVALDPWPYNGHTTSLDALWMGVPVVGLIGCTHVSRETFAVLALLGLEEFAANHVDDYILIASRLAENPQRLAQLRSTLRALIATSPLGDARGLTGRIEAAYRAMWQRWCARS